MAAKLERTSTPGIFRRHAGGCPREGRCDCTYAAVWREAGSQRTATYSSLAEAREGRALQLRRVKLRRGHAAGLHLEPQADCPECERQISIAEQEAPTLHAYARDWIERYQGTGRRGFREETREGYRWNLERFALSYFATDLRIAEVTPRAVADFIGWLARREKQGGGKLSDSGVRNAFKPLSVCLATARREGVIPHNPATDAVLPHRPPADDDQERAQPFPGDTMELVVALVHPDHRLMFELLAATGLRRSELIALEGRHLRLDGAQPFVQVRQRIRRRKGEGLVTGPLKSRYARRDLPISVELADRLRAQRSAAAALVFTSSTGTALDPDNLYERVLSPACEEAGVEWGGFHTFRHTVASRLFAAGRNAVKVQRWLGHHSPSFTLDTYVHLLDADLGEPLAPVQVNTGSTDHPERTANGALPELVVSAT